MKAEVTSAEHFEKMYRKKADPWAFATSAYEQGRYRAIVNALAGRRFRRGFEPGCSVGVLTEQLGGLCARLEAIDFSATAVKRARDRCSPLPHVAVTQGALPQDIPGGTFDLVVLSEIGYYFQQNDLQRIGEALVEQLEPGGVLLAAHWLGHSPDHVLSGDQVHEVLGHLAGLRHASLERHEGFRLETWVREGTV